MVKKGQKYKDIAGMTHIVTGVNRNTIVLKSLGGAIETIVKRPTFRKQYKLIRRD